MALSSTEEIECANMIARSMELSTWLDPHNGPTCDGCEGLSGDSPVECAEELMDGGQIIVKWNWPFPNDLGWPKREGLWHSSEVEVTLQDFLSIWGLTYLPSPSGPIWSPKIPCFGNSLHDPDNVYSDNDLYRKLLRIACFGSGFASYIHMTEVPTLGMTSHG